MILFRYMILFFVVTGIFISLAFIPQASTFTGCEEDCLKCHSLDKTEVKEILRNLKLEQSEPLEIKMSPVKGLWEVRVEDKGRSGLLYVSFSKKHIIKGPVVEVKTGINETQKVLEKLKSEAPKYVDYSKIPRKNFPVIGDPAAVYRVVVFTDPDCAYCALLHDEIKKVAAERKDIAFSLMLYPLSIHPDAYWKSQTVICSESLIYLEDNFSKKPIPKPGCDTKVVDDNIKLAREFGITGTPAMVMPDGLLVSGFMDAEAIKKLVLSREQRGG